MAEQLSCQQGMRSEVIDLANNASSRVKLTFSLNHLYDLLPSIHNLKTTYSIYDRLVDLTDSRRYSLTPAITIEAIVILGTLYRKLIWCPTPR